MGPPPQPLQALHSQETGEGRLTALAWGSISTAAVFSLNLSSTGKETVRSRYDQVGVVLPAWRNRSGSSSWPRSQGLGPGPLSPRRHVGTVLVASSVLSMPFPALTELPLSVPPAKVLRAPQMPPEKGISPMITWHVLLTQPPRGS